MLKILRTWNLALKRCLTVTETSIALRPFILRVHPDLFNRYGEDKVKKNEDSLKKLNEFIHKIHNKEKVHPISLLFHLRQVPQDPNSTTPPLNPVTIRLSSSDVVETVKQILKSCDLPLTYISSHSTPNNPTHQHTVKYDWDWFEGRGSGRRTQIHEDSHKNYHQTLQAWLVKNSQKARVKEAGVQKKKEEVERLRVQFLSQTGLSEVVWRDGWSMTSHGTALRTLIKLFDALPDPQAFRGRRVVFSNVLGVSVQGDLVLQQDTVSTAWGRVLREAADSRPTLQSIPLYERQLSEMLGGIGILPPRNSVCIAENYLQHVQLLIKAVRGHKVKTGSTLQGYQDIQVSIECTTGPMVMSEEGVIMIPSSCPVFLLFQFIHNNAHKARNLSNHFKTTRLTDEALISLCQSMLNIKNLTRDSSITREQMVSCCKRVIQLLEGRHLDVDLSGLSVRFGQLYSISVEGEICIPWNFQ